MFRCLKWEKSSLAALKGGMMNVNQLIWELRNERSRLDEAILALERLIPNHRGNRRTALRLVRGTPARRPLGESRLTKPGAAAPVSRRQQ